jgi:S-methylmethionine-dependent homocysteine/selenocysteine methylase
MYFVERLRSSSVILTQGAILTRLTYEFNLPTPDSATFVHLFNPAGRDALNKIYRGYMQIASDHDLPMLVKTRTWRAHPRRVSEFAYCVTSQNLLSSSFSSRGTQRSNTQPQCRFANQWPLAIC